VIHCGAVSGINAGQLGEKATMGYDDEIFACARDDL